MKKIIELECYRDEKQQEKKKDTTENKESTGIRSGEQINEITETDRGKDIKTVHRFKKLYENLLYKEVIKKG
jgi:hypothetical protein